MNRVYTTILLFLVPICFICDILFGSVTIPLEGFWDIFSNNSDSLWYNIIMNLRIPRAITALLVGLALPISGLLMQTLFKNPLADPYILGVSTGASLGVALFSLAGGILSGLIGSIGIVFSAFLGSTSIILLILSLATKVRSTISLLLIGIMFGCITAAIVNVLQYFSDPNEIHDFVLWTMGSFSNTNTNALAVMSCIILPTILATFIISKQLDTILLGENYARALGVKTAKLRFTAILISSILASTVTAFTGPIGFIGLTVPHITRFLFKTNCHKTIIPNALLIGVNLMLLCDLISQLPGLQLTLPINTVTSIIGAPIVILIIFRNTSTID
ncbi:MAG: iron ABC transporter permease [Bacteroidales bacterium]|nr:iron ABC transporter permease [Bacteroidales bacterium]